MSESSLKEIKFKIYDVNSFKYPKYSIINGIKITNLKIFSKIISKNNILVYGNYDIVINYKNIIYSHYTSKQLIKYKKVFFHKPLYCNISKLGLVNSLNTKINLLSRPLPIYSLKKFPCPLFLDVNLCEVTLFLSISIATYNDNHLFNYNDINSNIANDYSSANNNNNNNNINLNSDNSSLNYDKCLNITSSPSNNHNYLDNNIFVPKGNPLIINNNAEDHPSSSINLYHNISKLSMRKLIETDVILGKGHSELFLEKIIDLSDPIKPIWKITKVMAKADITKIDISGEKAFANGFVYIDINYKTYLSLDMDAINGTIQYIHLSIPFSLCIDLVTEYNDKIKDSDDCKVSSIYVSEVHNLSSPTTIDNETIYNEFKGQFIVQVTVLVTRTVNIYI